MHALDAFGKHGGNVISDQVSMSDGNPMNNLAGKVYE